MKLSEMVAKRLRKHELYSRTIQLKLRYADFTTITRARSLDHATQLDSEISLAVRNLLSNSWDTKTPVRLLGVHAGSLETCEGQMSLLDEPAVHRKRNVFKAVDHIRDRFGDNSISLARTLETTIREKVHENPFDLSGKLAEKAEEDSE